MTTTHFNKLSEAEAERLAVLAEECAEVAQAAMKILRHGYESVDPTIPPQNQETNRTALERELADVFHHVNHMSARGDILITQIQQRVSVGKPGRARYMHHQDGKL